MLSKQAHILLAKLRDFATANPDSFVVYSLYPGVDQATPNRFPNDYLDFLALSNGATFGIITLSPIEQFDQNQRLLNAVWPNHSKWMCVGHVLNEPLLINDDGNVARLRTLYGAVDPESPRLEVFGFFSKFFDDYVLGPKYASLCEGCDADEWAKLQARLVKIAPNSESLYG